ncbi:MAG: hypothetical protein MJK10_19195 [Pseudomonadales bacterium]|nr:hypothetical protein [Pseudomonadales bacterium]NRA15260.1 hypothetical protein [Oceanospirillaceae bacterium]
MISLSELQYALEEQTPQIINVSTIKGDIPLSPRMMKKLEFALISIISKEIKMHKRELEHLVNQELDILRAKSLKEPLNNSRIFPVDN